MRNLFSFVILVTCSFSIFSCATENRSYAACAPGVSKITGEGDSWVDPFGGHAGVGMDFRRKSNPLGFRTEVIGTVQGAKYEETNVSGKVQFVYINLPLLLKYQKESRGFFAEAGVQPGILISAKDKYNGITDDYKKSTESFDFGIPVGIGYEFQNKLGVGVRVVPGISNINKGTNTDKDHNFLAVARFTYAFGK